MTIPEAIERARHHLVEVIPDLDQSSVELEELETPPDGSAWRFTFTANRAVDPNDISLQTLLRTRRSSKLVELRSKDGALIAIRNKAA